MNKLRGVALLPVYCQNTLVALMLGLNWKYKPPDSDIRRDWWILVNPATELY